MLLFNKIIVSLIFLQLLILTLSIPIKMYHDAKQEHITYRDVKQLHNHGNKQFALPDKIFAAEIHFSRIPHQYWEHRLQMVKAMGFNALSVYLMWNFHQVEKGKFDYTSGDKNFIGFLELASKYQLKVLFRPGPYVCAEWDYGGLPVRLLANKDLQIRANNKQFLAEVEIYFASLVQIIKKFNYKNQGPLIMLQIQNEYGWYGSDKSYIEAIRLIWRQLNVDLPEYYVDWFDNIQKCHWEGANIGINNGIKESDWIQTRKMEPNGYLLGGQIYSGWLTHWGQKWQGKSITDYTDQYQFLMSKNHSFSMYMAHGGSNFALTAGANGFDDKPFDYGAHVTSYDYDAPINEQGSPNEKFTIFRSLAKQYASWQIPDVPQKIKMIQIKAFIPSGFADLMQNLPKPAILNSEVLINFQDDKLKMWNQGFVLYQTQLSKGKHQINLTVHDFALIYLNDRFQTSLDRGVSTSHQIVLQVPHDKSILRILVESMGHINFGRQMLTDYKGLISFSSQVKQFSSQNKKDLNILNDKNIKNKNAEKLMWNIYTIPINQDMLNWKNKSKNSNNPRLFRYNLTLNEVGDTYLNMEGWRKGYVFVNGYNLGRYWNKGPQQKIFLPGVWLKQGLNDIVVFDLLMSSAKFITGDLSLFTSNDLNVNKQHQAFSFLTEKPLQLDN